MAGFRYYFDHLSLTSFTAIPTSRVASQTALDGVISVGSREEALLAQQLKLGLRQLDGSAVLVEDVGEATV
jgi:hypothetical protein